VSILVKTWKNPARCIDYNTQQWQLLIHQSRASYMLPRMANKLITYYQNGKIEDRIWHHFSSALLVAKRQVENTSMELNKIEVFFEQKEHQAVILKGAAYSATNLSASIGRTFNDIDILVDKSSVDVIESELWFLGFMPMKEDDYDKLYYRQWMHEIPPLQHIKRKTVLDVHHNILPLTSATTVNVEKLTEHSTLIPGYKKLSILSPQALILHSATHLFHEGEFDKGIRDLIDLELLFQQYFQEKYTFDDLVTLALATGLERELYYAIRYVHNVLTLELTEDELRRVDKFSPKKLNLAFLDFCFLTIFTPNHSSCLTWKKSLATNLLYWRGHLLRMPLKLLIPHLFKKSYMQIRDSLKRPKPIEETFNG